jgi:hypothetical protein
VFSLSCFIHLIGFLAYYVLLEMGVKPVSKTFVVSLNLDDGTNPK